MRGCRNSLFVFYFGYNPKYSSSVSTIKSQRHVGHGVEWQLIHKFFLFVGVPSTVLGSTLAIGDRYFGKFPKIRNFNLIKTTLLFQPPLSHTSAHVK